MTPKEKAQDIVNKFNPFVYCYIGSSMLTNDTSDVAIRMNAKQCALIAVDEIINIAYWGFMESGGKQEQEYWEAVKQEILAL